MNETTIQGSAGPEQCDVKIVLGERIFKPMGWTRKDSIHFGERKIGIIILSSENRQGTTVSLISGKQTPGRQKEWCVLQYQSCMAQGAPVGTPTEDREDACCV